MLMAGMGAELTGFLIYMATGVGLLSLGYWACEAIVCRSIHVWSHIRQDSMRTPLWLQMFVAGGAAGAAVMIGNWLGHHVLHLK